MEEFIGFGLVSLIVLGLFLGMKKIFNRKKNLFEYDDEIILDNKIVHYGPFSGSLMYPHRKFIFLLAFSSSFLSAGIDLRTIDNWGIDSWSDDTLVLQKTSDDAESNLYLEMARPYCISSDPTITTPVGDSNFDEEDRIKATMTVDRGKPKDIILKVFTILGEGSDADYVLKLHYFPSLSEGNKFEIKFSNASPLDDMSFSIKGINNAVRQSERLCASGYEFEEPEIQETSLI